MIEINKDPTKQIVVLKQQVLTNSIEKTLESKALCDNFGEKHQYLMITYECQRMSFLNWGFVLYRSLSLLSHSFVQGFITLLRKDAIWWAFMFYLFDYHY